MTNFLMCLAGSMVFLLILTVLGGVSFLGIKISSKFFKWFFAKYPRFYVHLYTCDHLTSIILIGCIVFMLYIIGCRLASEFGWVTDCYFCGVSTTQPVTGEGP